MDSIVYKYSDADIRVKYEYKYPIDTDWNSQKYLVIAYLDETSIGGICDNKILAFKNKLHALVFFMIYYLTMGNHQKMLI